MFDDNKKIGVGLCALGIFVGGTGCVLFFDRALLALANVSEPDEIPVTPQTCLAQLAFLTGIGFLLGLTKTIKFFFKPDKIAGSVFFFGGFVIIIWGWAIVGLLVQVYGVWKLFSAFLPNVLASLKLTPIGFIFDLPGFQQVSSWIYDQRRLPL